MPLTIRLSDLSTPQSWILPDATVNSDGIMTAAMVRALNAASGGSTATEVPFLVSSPAVAGSTGPSSEFGSTDITLPAGTVRVRVIIEAVQYGEHFGLGQTSLLVAVIQPSQNSVNLPRQASGDYLVTTDFPLSMNIFFSNPQANNDQYDEDDFRVQGTLLCYTS